MNHTVWEAALALAGAVALSWSGIRAARANKDEIVARTESTQVETSVKNVDAATQVTSTCLELLEKLERKYDKLEDEVEQLKEAHRIEASRARGYRAWALRLVTQIEGLGHEPVPFITEDE